VHPIALLGALGPAVMTFCLLNVSGKALLERRMRKTRPGYDDYVARTSGFFPRPPRRTPANRA
jgi:steroid 5-alpha reductase family enzyme